MTEQKLPVKMMTIRETAKTGILPEHAIRIMVKQQQIPALYIGKKALINYNFVVNFLQNLSVGEMKL